MGCFRLKESSGVIRALVCAAIGALGLSAWADTEVSDFDSLANAIATVEEDSVIVVTASIDLPATLVVDRKVTVRGDVTDPAAVVLDAGGTRRAVKISGGAIVEGMTIKNGYVNQSNAQGAGVYMTAGTLRNCVVRDCKQRSNPTYGTGIYMTGAGCLVEDCVVTACEGGTTSTGVGVYNNGGTVRRTLSCGNICYSSSYQIASGIGYYQTGAGALCDCCVISNNFFTKTYRDNGQIAGAYVAGGVMRNTLIAGNGIRNSDKVLIAGGDRGDKVGGLCVGAATIENCTIVDNVSEYSDYCAGVKVIHDNAVIRNCLITNNLNPAREVTDPTKVYDDTSTGTRGTWSHNVIRNAANVLSGETNIELDDVPFKSGTYELSSGSVCIGAGQVEDWMAGAVDLKQNARLRTADGRTVVDVGCFAFEMPAICVAIATDSDREQFDGLEASLTATVSGATDGLVYYWDIDGDGVADQTGAGLDAIQISTKTMGDYPVRLFVTNATEQAGVSQVILFKSRPSVSYVDANGTDPVWPYDDATKAATDLGAVCSAENLIAGMKIVIRKPTNGAALSISKTLTLDVPVTICGETGDPKDAVIDAGGTCRAVKMRSASVLSGLTVRNGRITASDGAGAGVWMTFGTVTNCIVTDCFASGSRSMGGCVYLSGSSCLLTHSEITKGKLGTVAYGCGVYNNGGTVRCCTIHGNLVNDDIYQGIGLFQKGSTAVCDACFVTNNTINKGRTGNARVAGVYIEGGVMRNSLIAGNGTTGGASDSVTVAAGGVYVAAGQLVNCTVADNFTKGSEDCAGIKVGGANVVVQNCIFHNNLNKSTANPRLDDVRTGTTGTWLNNVIKSHETVLSGESNIEISAVPFREGGYEPDDGASAIGAGKVESWMAESQDLAGLPRLRSVGEENVVDVGCYTYVQPPLAVSISSVSAELQFDHLTVDVDALAEGETDGLVYYWDIDGDGKADLVGSELPQLNISTNAVGLYSVTLYVTNGLSMGAKSATLNYKLLPSVVYFNSRNETPQWPYATRETAANVLTDAIAITKEGDGVTVKIAPGTNEVAAVATIDTQTTVEADDPSQETALKGMQANCNGLLSFSDKGSGTVRNLHFYRGRPGVSAKNNVLIENCTFVGCVPNGWGANGGGVYCKNSTVRNCVFRDSVNKQGYPGDCYGGPCSSGLGVYAEGSSLVERCLFENLTMGDARTHQGVALTLAGGKARNCLVRNCKELGTGEQNRTAIVMVQSGAMLINCTIVSNVNESAASVPSSGGVVVTKNDWDQWKGSVKNCIIWGNTARNADSSNWAGLAGVEACFSYCCTTPALSDEHSIAVDPMFKHPEKEDGKLKGSSPCAKAGFYDTTYLSADTLDLYGQPLVNSKGRVPMGCVRTDSAGMILLFK